MAGSVGAGYEPENRLIFSFYYACPQTGEQRAPAFHGREAERSTLNYRCPAAAYGLKRQGCAPCHQAAGANPGGYRGSLHILVPIAHRSPSWQHRYHRRSALEHIHNRMDHSFDFEQYFIRGLPLAVTMAMALGHTQQGHPQQMHSLVQPIPETG